MDMREWLAIRRVKLYENAEHAFANALSQSAMQLSFVKRARIDLQTSLGGRKGAGGVDVAGALAEDDDGILGWQLRGYVGEHSAKGLNTGLFYRRVVGESLAGVNVFADYEDGDDGDFWRWSIGGDVKSRLGELSANHYFAITDAQVVGDKTAYTREGYDVDLALRIPRLEWAKARVGYYNFKGEFGDEDENGFRAGLDLSPGDGLVVGVEYDDDDGKFGGNISYTHYFGETQQGAQRADDFNPRAHFYDSARREYSQRISRTSGGGGEVVNVNSAIDVGVFGGGVSAMIITAGSFALPATGTVTATTHATQNGNATLRQGWELVIGSNAQIEFRRGPTATLAVTGGSGTFRRNNANITLIQIGGADITLLGTRFDFEVNGGNVNITLHEGGLGIPASGVNVEVADMMASVVSGGNVVGCGDGQTVMAAGATAKCEVDNAVTVVDMTLVMQGVGANILAGSISLAGSNTGISASVDNPAFTVTDNGNTGFNVHLIAASAVADRNVKVARVTVRGSSLQTPKEFVFSVRVNPQPINLMFVGNINNAPLTMPGDIIIGTLQVTNGFGATNINFAAGSGADFRLDNIDNAPHQRALILTGDNTSPRAVSVTVTGDDDNASQTPAALLSVTVMVVDRVGLRGGGRYSVYAESAQSAPVVIFEPFGGTPPFSMQTEVAPTNVPAGFSRQNDISATITRTTDNAVGGMEHEFIQEITEMRTNGDSATATATITVIATLSAGVSLESGRLDAGVAKTIATLSAAGGLGDYVFSTEQSGISFAEGTILIARFDNPVTITFSVVVDDRENGNPAPITPPFTLGVSLTAFGPLTLPQILITITTAARPASGDNNTPIFTVTAQGGTPPYTYGYFLGGEFGSGADQFVAPRVALQYKANSSIIYRFNSQARDEPGMEEQTLPFAVRDSSTPPRVYVLAPTIHYVLPPPVTLSVNQTVNSTPAGASSVAVATLTYTGGSTGGALTATVVGVKDGSGAVSDNEVLMSASAAGEVIATINAYDSTNATTPNATAQITVTFTGGG